MPRPRKPARLWQRKDGRWLILDGGKQFHTGLSGAGAYRDAEAALARHIASRLPVRMGPAQPSEMQIAEALALYVRLKGPEVASFDTLEFSVAALASFWTGTCDTIRGETCRAYVTFRAAPREREYVHPKTGRRWRRIMAASGATARRELGVLQAAMHLAHAEGRLLYAPQVTLPEGGAPRDRWLTRQEAARLIRAAAPHVRRFIVITLRAGRRAGATLDLRLAPSLDAGYFDPGTGILHFEGARQRRTRKRKGSIATPPRLAAHFRRWIRLGGSHAIMWQGKPVAEIDTAFSAAARRAGLEDVTIHDLKRTAVTWAFQRGMTLEEASDWFRTSPATLMKHYRVHSPHYQKAARAKAE